MEDHSNISNRRALENGPAGRPIPRDPDALLLPSETGFLIGVKERTLEAKRLRGGGPPFIRISRRCVRYRRQDVLDWIAERRRRSTSDPGPTPAEGGSHD